jgi:hypothetical protein
MHTSIIVRPMFRNEFVAPPRCADRLHKLSTSCEHVRASEGENELSATLPGYFTPEMELLLAVE